MNLCDYPRQGPLNRPMVLPWRQTLERLAVDIDALAALEGQCQSVLERQFLRAIRDRGLPLPDESQATIPDRDGSPLAVAGVYCRPGRVVTSVDSSPHRLDHVRAADDRKRRRVVVVRGQDLDSGLGESDMRKEL